jgi:hypothetical protein
MKDFDKLVKASTAKPKVNPTKHERYKFFCQQAGVCVTLVTFFMDGLRRMTDTNMTRR